MREIIYIFFALIVFSCSSSKKTIQNDISKYRIKKITSKNSWYVIYAEKQDSLYKIVTGKEKGDNDCQKIAVGKYYDLELKSRRENIPVIGGIKLKPVNYLDVKSSSYDKEGVECYSYDKKTEICTEPQKGIYDVYYTEDLKGLCFLK